MYAGRQSSWTRCSASSRLAWPVPTCSPARGHQVAKAATQGLSRQVNQRVKIGNRVCKNVASTR